MLFAMLGFSCFCRAQDIIIQNNINLPQDPVVKQQLINALNGFLAQKEKPNNQNTFVLKEELLATSALLDEMKGLEHAAKNTDKSVYKGYLTNVTKVDADNFIVQFAYMGTTDGAPVLRAGFTLLAKRAGDIFYFSSPLTRNTKYWRSKKRGNITFYYKDILDNADAKAYQKKVEFYDKKLKATDLPIEFYYCDNFPEVLQLLGVDYKADYNGIRNNILASQENNTNLMINGWNSNTNRFDTHDLWHERLRTVMSSAVINRPVDEGCAYLYGGSWGYTWEEIQVKFKKYVADNPNADWLKLYLETTNFEAGEKPLKAGYVLNALIAQKIEREKGFAPVMELLGCGPREKGDENYFKVLEKLTGINKANFNKEMWVLIKGM